MSRSDAGGGASAVAAAAAAAAAAHEEHERLWQRMDPYDQVMDDSVPPSDVLMYMATSWLPTAAHVELLRGWRAGKLRPLTEKIADNTVDGKKLAIFPLAKGYDDRFRHQLTEAMQAWARAHPEELAAAAADAGVRGFSIASGAGDEEKQQPAADRDEEKRQAESPAAAGGEELRESHSVRRESLPRGAKDSGMPLLSEDALAAAPLARAHELAQQQRSPARSQQSVAAAVDPAALEAAVAAVLSRLPPVPGGPAGAPAVAGTPPRARAARVGQSKPPSPPDVRLLDAGAGDSESSDDDDDEDDSEWLPGSDGGPVPSPVRRGGRLRDEDVDHQLAQAGVERSFASGFLRNARFAAGGRSMYQLYKEVTAAFPHESSKRECIALSRILDALLRGDVSAALEHTCRRLGGVQTAATTGNWAMCERLETEAEQRSFVPDHFMRSALKSVVQMQAVMKSVPSGGTARGGSRGTATDQKGNGRKRSTSKPKDAKPDTGAGSSNKAGGSGKK
jgi:hypothetical protein